MSKEIDYVAGENIEKIDIMIMLTNFFHAIKKSWKKMLIFILIGSISCTLYENFIYRASYTASSTYAVYLNSSSSGETGSNYYNNSVAKQVGETFPYILTSSILQRKVAIALGIDSVPGEITAKVKENTNFLTISVKDTEPQRAYDTLQAVINNYQEVSEPIIGRVTMDSLDETGIPATPDTEKNLKGKAIEGGILGLLMGILYALIMIFVRKTILREEDCKKKINIKCLGTIPHVREKERSKKIEMHPTVIKKNIDRDFVEGFQIVRNKIEQSAKQHNLKSILITSAMSGEGKSTVAVNIALSLAKAGKNVALVDADLRNPSDSEILQIKEGKGLIDYLKGNAEFSECIMQGKEILSTPLPLLYIKGGKPVEDGAEVLANHRIKELIEILEQKMDYVIIDTPPVGLLTDCSILAQYVDGAVFVVKQDYVKANDILESMENLTDSNVYMMGCVLNEE